MISAIIPGNTRDAQPRMHVLKPATAQIKIAPVTESDAHAMIREVKGLAVIRGYRGMPMGDCNALARTVSAFSQLAHVPGVTEAEVNPLIVKAEGEGVVAVDGLIVRR